MPRWPEKKDEEIPEESMEVADNPETPILVQIRSLAAKIEDQSIAFHNLTYELASIKALEETLKEPASEREPVKRRRDEIELRRALKTLASGQARPKDDESEQVLSDCIGELFAMRQLNHDLMQSLTSAYQHGLVSVRKLTER